MLICTHMNRKATITGARITSRPIDKFKKHP